MDMHPCMSAWGKGVPHYTQSFEAALTLLPRLVVRRNQRWHRYRARRSLARRLHPCARQGKMIERNGTELCMAPRRSPWRCAALQSMCVNVWSRALLCPEREGRIMADIIRELREDYPAVDVTTMVFDRDFAGIGCCVTPAVHSSVSALSH